VPDHLAEIAGGAWGSEAGGVRSGGATRNEQTAMSNVELLRRSGYRVHTKGVDWRGIEAVRLALRPAEGRARLSVHPRCGRLRRALGAYRYGTKGSETPLKDGVNDHLIDALRYFFVNGEWGA